MQSATLEQDEVLGETTDLAFFDHGRTTWAAAPEQRLSRLLARVRHRQLQLALAGHVKASGRYARRAGRLRAWRQRAASTLAVFIALLLGVTAAQAQPAPPAAVVRAEQVRREMVQQHQRVTGTLRAVSRAAVAAQEEGAVVRVLVDEGDPVRRGQVMAELDTRRISAQLAEIQAELAAGRAQIAEQQAELVRRRRDAEKLAELHATHGASQREYDDARTAVDVAEARLESARRSNEQAQQRAALLQIRLDDMRIVAPFDGRVVDRHVEPGVWVRAGQAVATIVSSGRIEARLEVPERLAEAVIAHTQPLSIVTDGDRVARPTLAIQSVPQVDARVRTFALIADLDNSNQTLLPGMSVSAWVPAGEAAVRMTVPKDAVVRTAQGAMVFRATEQGSGETIAQPVAVKVLFETADRVAVESEQLAHGDLVVVEGNERLRPSTPLVFAAE